MSLKNTLDELSNYFTSDLSVTFLVKIFIKPKDYLLINNHLI